MPNTKISDLVADTAITGVEEFAVADAGTSKKVSAAQLLAYITAAESYFRLSANGSAIGPAINDFFGANSALSVDANSVYELVYDIFYLKTTAGTITYTLTNSNAYVNLVADYEQTAVAGIATNAASTSAGIVGQTTAASALPVTSSLTTAVNHHAVIRAVAETGASAGNIRLRITSSAGTVTPLRGSMYFARKLSTSNVGSFVA